ncbi:Hypothetical predicted protein [Pelobates cultripes]|uniref:Uncharacterized protein n=1 Tax=Pelobates cultripes TaxID=61616 RepID=A0AAD1WBJ6_PELCU|nr:Hypothetical predicted protein [Pelobates cultripes]
MKTPWCASENVHNQETEPLSVPHGLVHLVLDTPLVAEFFPFIERPVHDSTPSPGMAGMTETTVSHSEKTDCQESSLLLKCDIAPDPVSSIGATNPSCFYVYEEVNTPDVVAFQHQLGHEYTLPIPTISEVVPQVGIHNTITSRMTRQSRGYR